MLKPVENVPRQARLADMGVVRAQGADAVKFLQGQVSNDVERLSADHSVLAGLHNPQGRAIALLRLVLAAPDDVLALLPRELAAPVAARLVKFVLRAKVKISDASAEWQVSGVQADGIAEGSATASVRVGPSRWLVLTRAGEAHDPQAATTSEADAWRALDIAAGIPQVYAATSEAFVAQMLNLDLIDGIAFDKGCYTGQEVIARAHYRGKVKRRMQRFRTTEPATLHPGDAGTLGDGRSFKVVDSVQLSDGRNEFLAVTTFSGHGSDDASESPAVPSSANPAPSESRAVNAELLALPYSLPT